MTKLQTLAVILAILSTPFTGYAGKVAADWALSFHHKDCNAQAEEWLNRFPANQPLASMPSFACKL